MTNLHARLTEAAAEYQNDLQSDLSRDHMASVSRRWAEYKALPLLREAAAELTAAEQERDAAYMRGIEAGADAVAQATNDLHTVIDNRDEWQARAERAEQERDALRALLREGIRYVNSSSYPTQVSGMAGGWVDRVERALSAGEKEEKP